MNTQGSIITDIGHALIQAACLEGGNSLTFTYMAVGDGENEPTAGQTALQNEVYRGEINGMHRDADNPDLFIANLIVPPEAGGFTIREVGVFDMLNRLIAVGASTPIAKPMADQGGFQFIQRMGIVISRFADVRLTVSVDTPFLPSAFGGELMQAANVEAAINLLGITQGGGNDLWEIITDPVTGDSGIAPVFESEHVFSPAGSRSEVIPAETALFTPPYVVGSGQLKVYQNGILCIAGDDPSIHQYVEIGEKGTVSTKIKFNYDIGVQYDLYFIA